MSVPSRKFCPHLGLKEDRDSHFLYPESTHCCFSSRSPEAVESEHQERFCLAGEYRLCPRFAEAPAPATRSDEARAAPARPAQPLDEPDDYGYDDQRPGFVVPLRVALWVVTGVMTVLALFYLGFSLMNAPTAPVDVRGFGYTGRPSPTEPMAATQTPTPTPLPFDRLTPIPTPPPGGNLFVLTPVAEAVGWVASNEEEGNYFGDSYLHAGIYGGFIYYGAMQFNPSSVIAPGTPIYFAAVQVTGLSRERLGSGGHWELQLLGMEVDPDWPSHSFSDIHNARIEQSIPPVLGNSDLDKNKVYLYLPLRAAQHPSINWGDPRTGSGFAWLVSARLYRQFVFALPWKYIPARVSAWSALLVQQFGWWGLFLALIGLWFWWSKDRTFCGFLAIFVVISSVYAIGYNTTDSYIYLIPSFLVMALWLGKGVHCALVALGEFLPFDPSTGLRAGLGTGVEW